MTKVAALLMAAGNSRRMGGPNKLLLPFCGQPLVAHAVEAVKHANFYKSIMVTGRDHVEIAKYGVGDGYQIVHNPNYEQGFGTSLGAGFLALFEAQNIDGALVMLADMPLITSDHLNALIHAFAAAKTPTIIRASNNGVAGNPVIVPQALFQDMARLDGQQSGQAILKASGLPTQFVDIGSAAHADIDTPQALTALQEAAL